MAQKSRKWKLFWARLFYPVIYEELEEGKITEYFRSLSQQEILFPDGKRKKPSLSTLWRKWRAYKEKGLEGFVQKPRSDRGKIRTVDTSILEKAIEIKKDLPSRSAGTINAFLYHYYSKTIPESTLYRHLKQAGATYRKLGIDKKKVRGRFTHEATHSLWCGDYYYGPFVMLDGIAYRSYLSAFIDIHSRFIVDGRYYLEQNKPTLIDCLLRAFSIHGTPRALYVDNANVYYSEELEEACYELKIKLLHRPPNDPPPGGIIESFFSTVQAQFETEVRAGEIMDLEGLNRAFAAWLEMAYHQGVHSEIGESPRQRYENGLLTPIEGVDINTAVRFFTKKVKRKVHEDFSDVSIEGKLYKVDPRFRGDRLIVRYDEFCNTDKVLLYSLNDEYLGKGELHQREVKKQNPSPPSSADSAPTHDYISLLVKNHRDYLEKKSKGGIDFTSIVNPKKWPFQQFLLTLARLMGKKGGTSAFTPTEVEELKKAYERFSQLDENVVIEAVEKSYPAQIAQIIYQIQSILERK